MEHILVSYLRDDQAQVEELVRRLTALGADICVDWNKLIMGELWKDEIAKAIKSSAYYIACFSSNFSQHVRSGIKDELHTAIETLHQRQTERWLIPVKLDECEIPQIPIGEGRTLCDLHWISLAGEKWERGISALAEATLALKKKAAMDRLMRLANEVAIKDRVLAHAIGSYEIGASSYSQIERQESESNVALKHYQEEQVRFVQKFGEEYHPLSDLSPAMARTREQILQIYRLQRTDNERSAQRFVLIGIPTSSRRYCIRIHTNQLNEEAIFLKTLSGSKPSGHGDETERAPPLEVAARFRINERHRQGMLSP